MKVQARDVYRVTKMIGAALVTALAYYCAHSHNLSDDTRNVLEAVIAGAVVFGFYVSPSPIHASDVPVAVPPDSVEPETDKEKP